MAKYADYVKTDEIEQEIEEAASAAEDRQEEATTTIPDRFKGKSAEEIAASYAELEKLNSRQAQDLGRLRRTVDELVALELQKSAGGRDEPSTKPVTVEDLYEDPEGTVSRVVESKVSSRIEDLERELQQERLRRKQESFSAKFPNWQDDVRSPEFVDWVRESEYRTRLALDADKGDFDAAETLFGTYRDLKQARQEAQKKQQTRQRVREVGLESSGAGAPDPIEKFSRSELMEKRIAAKRGDPSAQRWLDAKADAIAIAYAEKRISD